MTDMREAPGQATCPVCGKPAVPATRPFCSRRCADVDLGRWLTAQYRIAGREEEPDEDPPAPPSDAA
jgi:uncharacterized protein